MLNSSSMILILISIIYPLIFMVVGRLGLDDFLKNELDIFDEKRFMLWVEEFHRTEQISYILCGFAIISLIFVITLFEDNYGLGEAMILLFSLAFIFEVISAFIYHGARTIYPIFLGAAFQYGGILSMMCGFFSFLLIQMDWSLGIYLVFGFGVLTFIGFTVRELKRDFELAEKFKQAYV